jgi:hypothetical protein
MRLCTPQEIRARDREDRPVELMIGQSLRLLVGIPDWPPRLPYENETQTCEKEYGCKR